MMQDTWYMIHDTRYMIHDDDYDDDDEDDDANRTFIPIIFMLMMMLDLWPQAETPGVTHFRAFAFLFGAYQQFGSACSIPHICQLYIGGEISDFNKTDVEKSEILQLLHMTDVKKSEIHPVFGCEICFWQFLQFFV